MSVLLETSLGDIVIDLYAQKAPKSATNFLKLCKAKYYNFSPFHTIQKNFMAQTGDPMGTKTGGQSVWGLMHGEEKRYFVPEMHPKLKHKKKGIVSWVTIESESGVGLAASQFFITLTDIPLDYLDGKQAVFGYVSEGMDIVDKLNEELIDDDGRPYRDIRIKHTIIIEDPFPDPPELVIPPKSPEPTAEMLKTVRITTDEELFPELDPEERDRRKRRMEANARALTLEMIGDIPFAEIKPQDNVLFVCKLNPVTRDDDLEIIFSRFGPIISCEIVRDKITGDSLQYAFIEFENKEDCEEAYFKMDNVLIDDRRIHVDFSQSVAKLRNGLDEPPSRNEYGGSSNLEKKSKYREGASERKEDYDMVFEDTVNPGRRRDDRSKSPKREHSRKKETYRERDEKSHKHSRRHSPSRSRSRDRRRRDKSQSPGQYRDEYGRDRSYRR